MFQINSIVYGVLIATGIYTVGMNVLCLIVVRKWYMFVIYLLSIVLFVILGTMYWKKSNILMWLGEHYDACYLQCQTAGIVSSVAKWIW